MRKRLPSGDGDFGVASRRFVARSLDLPLSSLLEGRKQVFIHTPKLLALRQNIRCDSSNAEWLRPQILRTDLHLLADRIHHDLMFDASRRVAIRPVRAANRMASHRML